MLGNNPRINRIPHLFRVTLFEQNPTQLKVLYPGSDQTINQICSSLDIFKKTVLDLNSQHNLISEERALKAGTLTLNWEPIRCVGACAGNILYEDVLNDAQNDDLRIGIFLPENPTDTRHYRLTTTIGTLRAIANEIFCQNPSSETISIGLYLEATCFKSPSIVDASNFNNFQIRYIS